MPLPARPAPPPPRPPTAPWPILRSDPDDRWPAFDPMVYGPGKRWWCLLWRPDLGEHCGAYITDYTVSEIEAHQEQHRRQLLATVALWAVAAGATPPGDSEEQ